MAVENTESGGKPEKKLKRSEIKRRKQEELLAGQTGVWLGEVEEPYVRTKNLSVYLVNAVLNFMIVWGAIGCVLEGMEVEWNPFIVIPVLLFLAVGMSFFYRNSLVRLIGYLIVMASVVLGVQQFMLYMRSGFAVISNKVMEVLELELSLPIEREYEVYVDNTAAAVSISLISIGLAAMLLFNIVISETKNYWIVLFFTFPLVQLPIYLGQKVPIRHMIMYATGIFILYCLRNGGHYSVIAGKQKNFFSRKWRKDKYYVYRADGKSNLYVSLSILAAAVIAMLVLQAFYPRTKHAAGLRQSQWRVESEAFAKRLALVGFYGMFYRNSDGIGGVGTGRLGNVNIVRMDYEPDLFLYTEKTQGESSMYLRSFSGKEYADNQWSLESEEENRDNCVHSQMADEFVYLDSMDQELLNIEYKNIRIENVGANEQFPYIPYWNNVGLPNKYYTGKKGTESRLAVGYYTDRTYMADLSNYSVMQIKQVVEQVQSQGDSGWWSSFFRREEEYREFVYDNYLQIDEQQKERLLDFCMENGIDPRQDNVVEQVQIFLRDNYTYTLMPGITPRNEDFVDYFLYTQKKGYCAHFASSAVLLYRSMGIPARYVVGYAISAVDFNGSRQVNTNTLRGWSFPERSVQKIEVIDATAHAWVEVYIDGFGWYPVEVTTSESEDDELMQENNQALQNFIQSIFGPEVVQRVRDTTIRTILWLIRLAVILFILYLIASMAIRTLRRKRWSKNQNDETLCSMFDYFGKMARASGCRWREGSAYRQMGETIGEYFSLESEDVERLVFLLEQAKYSSRPVNAQDREWYHGKVLEYTRKMYESLSWYRKIKVRWIKNL